MKTFTWCAVILAGAWILWAESSEQPCTGYVTYAVYSGAAWMHRSLGSGTYSAVVARANAAHADRALGHACFTLADWRSAIR